jgi:hypothetical protein
VSPSPSFPPPPSLSPFPFPNFLTHTRTQTPYLYLHSISGSDIGEGPASFFTQWLMRAIQLHLESWQHRAVYHHLITESRNRVLVTWPVTWLHLMSSLGTWSVTWPTCVWTSSPVRMFPTARSAGATRLLSSAIRNSTIRGHKPPSMIFWILKLGPSAEIVHRRDKLKPTKRGERERGKRERGNMRERERYWALT